MQYAKFLYKKTFLALFITLWHTIFVKNLIVSYSNHSTKCFFVKYFSLSLLFLLSFLCFSPSKAFSQDYFILNSSNYTYNQEALELELFFSFKDIEGLERKVRSGTSININFYTSLHESSFFMDSKLYEEFTGWQLRYEALSNDYILYFENLPPRRSHDLEYLLSTILKQRSYTFTQIPPLKEDEDYYIEIYINLQQATTPPWLESTLFFWSWDAANLNYSIDLKIK